MHAAFQFFRSIRQGHIGAVDRGKANPRLHLFRDLIQPVLIARHHLMREMERDEDVVALNLLDIGQGVPPDLPR